MRHLSSIPASIPASVAASVPALLVPLLLLSFGCAHHNNAPQYSAQPYPGYYSTAPGPMAGMPPAPMPQVAPAVQSCRADTDCGAKQLCLHNRCTDIGPGVAECSQVRIHFDFDAAEVRPEEQPLLIRVARCLKADQALHVVIQGNADERGTQAYNLSLGDRRATAVARYLEGQGVSADQLRTVSYGKENPLCVEHDEECWSKNRRAAIRSRQTAAGRRSKM